MGTVDSTQDVYRNIWAVKVRGSLQDAKQLSFKHGFVYDKHMWVLPLPLSLNLLKTHFNITIVSLKRENNVEALVISKRLKLP